ncbi:plasma membrane localization protein [Coemansia sp. RSA 921]|nr:plasma membrane localization protein [Coemansia sp. RSA 921]KAJ2204281.1 plasma membrane localization protein [Coemansia sp. RSA 521]
MSEHKLRKINEHNSRLKEQLELPRIPVSQASDALIEFTKTTKDYLIPSLWGPPPHDPFASQTGGTCGCSHTYPGLDLPPPPPEASIEDSPASCMPSLCLPCPRLQLSTSAHPPSDFILFHPLFRRYVKHASLVERCYPLERTEDSAPSSNELSYLVYYVQSKPAKLTKVGAYLSKRIAKDVQRRRRPDVCVGLRIYDALLDACARDLNFFAKDVLSSLDSVLAADDLELAKRATHTFALFCRSHSGSTLGIDKHLCSLYSHLIRTFVAYMRSRDAANIALGLCGVQAIADSQATYADDCYYELPLVASAIASRIAVAPTPKSAVPSSIEEQLAAISTNALPSDEQLGLQAWRCVETLVRRSHGQHSRIIVAEIFRYLDNGLKWQPVSLCVHVVIAVVGQLQPQDQNMVIVETLAFLTDGAFSSQLYLDSVAREDSNTSIAATAPTDKDGSRHERKISNRRACIIRILERLFCKPYVLVGISVMEALNVLVTYLLESVGSKQLASPDQDMLSAALQIATARSGPDDSIKYTDSVGESGSLVHPGQMSDFYHLLAAIGGLAKHQYYNDQLLDMVNYLVSQMQLTNTEQPSSGDRLVWLLQALYIVLRTSRLSTTGGQEPLVLSLEAYAPLFTLLSHDSTDCRVLAADCIAEALQSNTISGSSHNWNLTPSAELIDAVYYKLSESLKEAHTMSQRHLVVGYAGTATILRGLLKTQGTGSVEHTLVLVDGCGPASTTGAWTTLLAMVWAQVASLHKDTSLETHVGKLIAEARDLGLWEHAIEHVCLQRLRVAEIGDGESPSLSSLPTEDTAAPTDSIQDMDAANALLQRLSSSAVLELLGPEAVARYTDIYGKNTVVDDKTAERVLCKSSGTNTNAVSLLNAVDQVKDIRARVSVDWEAQVRRDSIVAPHINVEQLRAALRDGLALHGDRVSSQTEAGTTQRQTASMGAVAALQSRDVLDTIAQSGMYSDSDDESDVYLGGNNERGRSDKPAIPAEVRDLLDSIDDFGASPLETQGSAHADSRSTAGINTPVIGDVN